MKTSDFDFVLPPDRIAAHPSDRRDGARLLVIRPDLPLEHRVFSDLPSLLPPSALIVLNDARVLPARLFGTKPTGGRIELLLLRNIAAAPDGGRAEVMPSADAGESPVDATHDWEALGRGLAGLAPGTRVAMPLGAAAEILGHGERGVVRVRFHLAEREGFHDWLNRAGEVPLPPYIVARRREAGDLAAAREEDRERYQTVYARTPGAVAAPTAGLHFTPEILAALAARGHALAYLTLHVGPGTFRAVATDDAEAHVMDAETYEIPPETAKLVEAARAARRPIVAIGTTVVRALESAARAGDGAVRAGTASSELFLRPGSAFHVVTDLVTNFHLPRSTLLMLVSAFAGREVMLDAYARAIEQGYRFYSYGDAMLIRKSP